MRIVAGDAAQFLATPSKTPAGIHLLDMTHGFLLIQSLGGKKINRNEGVQGKTGTIIQERPVAFLNAILSLKMALLAHSFAQRWIKASGVDNRVIKAVLDLNKALPFSNMELAGSMAALAADRITLENR